MLKTRFAPSPSGLIHLGNARTAIHSALASKAYEQPPQGVFQLRIEDTDSERSKQHYIDSVQADLQSLGWQWQEGINAGGEESSYQQSQRLPIYQQYFEQLLQSGYAYRCFCTPEDLQKMRLEQKLAGLPPRYDGRCSRLDTAVIAAKIAANAPYVLRFNTSFAHAKGAEIQFDDLVKGKQRFPRHEIADFIICKTDGTPTFFFSNAVDDALMGVTHVLRGDDHLTNTPRQLMILQALGLPIPQYAHLSTILGEDGQPLSKRNGSRSIKEMLQQGWLAGAINNYLARLGHYYRSEALLTNQQLSEQFSFSNLSKSAAKFDWELLKHWQRKALMALDAQQQWQWLRPVLGDYLKYDDGIRFAASICNNILLPTEALEYYQIIYQSLPNLDEQQQQRMQQLPASFFQSAIQAYQQQQDFAHITNEIKQATGLKGKALFLPLRLALTGKSFGPEMQTLIKLIPAETVIQRLKYWHQSLHKNP